MALNKKGHEMQIKKGLLCRDKGLIFQKLTFDEGREGISLKASVSTKHDRETPCDIYMLNLKEFVLCIPDFKITQHVSIEAIDGDGSVVSKLAFSVNGQNAKWASKFHYLTSRNAAFEIRNINLRHLSEKADICFDEICVGRRRRVLRGHIVLPLSDSDVRITIRMIDEKSRQVGKPKEFSIFEVDEYAGLDARSHSIFPYSIDIPKKEGSYFISVSVSGYPDLDNFAAITKWMYKKMVSDFVARSLDANENPAYSGWFDHHKANDRELARQRDVKFAYTPKFSIVVPLFNTPIGQFHEMACSVVSQSYPNWELILVNASPDNEDLKSRVRILAESDSRIRVIDLDDNYGITENTNRGVEKATGDYVAFFDHDDVLEPDILFEYAKAINEDPGVDMLYCDEDKLLDNGSYAFVNFKPDFSIDQLRNNNYICHMLTIRKPLLDRIGPIPEGFDGAQDHWLTLRVAEEAKSIKHVPKVLYHWRAAEGSTALSDENKSYATDAGIRAIQDHLDRLGIEADVERYGRQFAYRVKYSSSNKGLVSIIIPSHNGMSVLRKCIDSILEKTSYDNYEIVIVENNSDEAALFDYYDELASSNDKVKMIEWKGEGFNFSTLINYGVANSKGEFLLLLNNDTEVLNADWLDVLVGYAARPEVGAVGPRLWYPDDTYQHAGLAIVGNGVARLFVDIPEEGKATKYLSYHDMTRNVSAVTGACLMTRRDVFDEVGGFDEGFSVAFNDVDFCLRCVECGYLIVYTADTSLYHYESYTRGADFDGSEKNIRVIRELSRFRDRWAEIYVKGDPYYNRNLRQEEPWACYFGLADY